MHGEERTGESDVRSHNSILGVLCVSVVSLCACIEKPAIVQINIEPGAIVWGGRADAEADVPGPKTGDFLQEVIDRVTESDCKENALGSRPAAGQP